METAVISTRWTSQRESKKLGRQKHIFSTDHEFLDK